MRLWTKRHLFLRVLTVFVAMECTAAKVTIPCDAPSVRDGQPATVTCDFRRNVSALSSPTVTVDLDPYRSSDPGFYGEHLRSLFLIILTVQSTTTTSIRQSNLDDTFADLSVNLVGDHYPTESTKAATVTITSDAPSVRDGQAATVTYHFPLDPSALSSATVTVEHYPDGSIDPSTVTITSDAPSVRDVEHYPDGSIDPYFWVNASYSYFEEHHRNFWVNASYSYFEERHRNFWVNASYSYSVEHHQYSKEDYVKDPSLIGADPSQRTCPLVHTREAGLFGLLLVCLSFLLLPVTTSAKRRRFKAQCSAKGGTKKLDKYSKEDYVKDPSLIGANPLQRTCPLVHKRKAGQTDGRQLFSNLPNESNISKTLQEYANKCSDWCGWISGALPAFFDLPVTTQPPKDVVQAFLVGVDRPPILLTVCQNAEEDKEDSREEAREYASETASALKWRLLDFCHLDFLLLLCVVPNNFDLNDLEDEIKKQLQNLSWCHSGPKTLDKNTFPTMKAAANALARSTRVPDLLTTNNETEKMETLVMEEEWGDVLQGHIDTWSGQAKESGGSLQLKLDRDVPFKEKVAAIEAMKRLSVRNSVTVVTPAPDIKLDDCIQRLRKEVADRYNVSLQIKVAPEEPSASDQTANPSEPMSLVQGLRGMETTNRG